MKCLPLVRYVANCSLIFLVALAWIALVPSSLSAQDTAASPVQLFDGSTLRHWSYQEGGWEIDDEHSLTCNMTTRKRKDGTTRTVGMGYIWSKQSYGDFRLTLSYRLSKGANSGIFFRTDPEDPVQGGFEIQLLDNAGFQKAKGDRSAKKLNGALYDAKGPTADPSRPVGQWNTITLTCKGSLVSVEVNETLVVEADLANWTQAGKNPDGTDNKFKRALSTLPSTGHIGLQNHGNKVWFRDIQLVPLAGD